MPAKLQLLALDESAKVQEHVQQEPRLTCRERPSVAILHRPLVVPDLGRLSLERQLRSVPNGVIGQPNRIR